VELEAEAAAQSELAAARPLYEALHSRFAGREEGVRAALWLGRYHYGTGAVDEALRYFKAARSGAADPEIEEEAVFWCEQARLLAGREPLPLAGNTPAQGFWQTLRSLCRVDRLVRQGRADEAKARLHTLADEVRSLGLYGLLLVRWGDVLRLQGGEPAETEEIGPLIDAACGLPERLHLERPLVGTVEAQMPGESWSLEFGAHVDLQEARAQQDELRAQGLDTRIDETRQADRQVYQVRLGEFSSRAEIDSFASGMTLDAAAQPRIVRVR
jgi:hypothetical protein